MKKITWKTGLLTVISMVLLLAVGKPAAVEAGTSYVPVSSQEDIDASKTAVKHGNYYFKCGEKDEKVRISTQKNSGYKKTPIPYYSSFTNGSQAYYVRGKALYRYVFASGQEKKLKNLPVKGDRYYYVSTIYGNRIFITMESFDEWLMETYSYNVKTGQLKKTMTDCAIEDRSGKYVIARTEYQSDVSAHPLILCKITSKGLTKVKTLSKYSLGYRIIDGKIYYTSYTGIEMKKGSLCRCNINGDNREKLFTTSTKQEYGQVMIGEITGKDCTIFKDDKHYRYTYATQKMTEIKQ